MSLRSRFEYAVKKTLPRPLVNSGLYAYSLVRDGVDMLAGLRDPLVPPTRLMHDGPRGIEVFKRDGEEFLRYLVDLAGLEQNERILDVGCGIGRKAVALARHLDATGSYEGFDVVPSGVDWARTNVTPRYPSFRFQLADVRNPRYHPEGRFEAAGYRFPFDDGEFDLAISTSVFTHMRREETERYLSEMSRVLSDRGRCLISYFLLNEESRRLIDAGRAELPLAHPVDEGRCWTANPKMPQDAIGMDEAYFLDLLERVGFRAEPVIRYGSWCGRESFLSYQDLVVAAKTD